MKNLSEFYQRLNHAHLVFLLVAAVVLSLAALCDDFGLLPPKRPSSCSCRVRRISR